MKRYALILLIAVPGFVTAADVAVHAVDVVGFGIFASGSSHTVTGFTDRSVPRDDVTGVRFIEYTDQIPMQLGVNFGFQYQINSRPAGREVAVVHVIKLPDVGMKRPGGRRYHEFRDSTSVRLGKKTLHGYGFDEAWEFVPGTWTFEVWYNQQLIARRDFEIVPPVDAVE